MKLCIVVFGNIASGKTTFAQSLGLRHICLDKHREKLRGQALAPMAAEHLAEKNCLAELLPPRQIFVYETTGGSRFFQKAKAALEAQGCHFFFVKIECSTIGCVRRFNARKSAVPLPFRSKSLLETMQQLAWNARHIVPDVVLDSEKMNLEEMKSQFLAILGQKNFAGWQVTQITSLDQIRGHS